jgi:hypothetical protein
LLSKKIGLGYKYGLLVATIICFYPPSIYYADKILTENFASLFVVSSALFLLKHFETKSLLSLLIASLFFILLSLTRSSYLYLPIFLIIIFLLRDLLLAENRLTNFSKTYFFIFCLIFAMPWTYRNYIIHDEFMPTSSRLGYGLYLANSNLDDEYVQQGAYSKKGDLLKDDNFLKMSEIDQNKIFMSEALDEIQKKPYFFFSAAKNRFLNTLTWRPNPYARENWILSDYIMFFIWVPILILFLFSFKDLYKNFFLLTWSYLFYILLVSLFFWGVPRLRFPVDPLIIITSVFIFSGFVQSFLYKKLKE